MTGPTAIGKAPITIVELEQPRCINRFGTSPCTATGTPKCYNTGATCADLPNFTPTGSIKWRFMDGRPGAFDYSDMSDPDNQELPPIPCAVSVSTSEGQINAGANLDGRSALGVTSKVTITLQDFPWNDQWGDFYAADRTGYVAGKPNPTRANFWALWTARNALFNDMILTVYDGYEGQAITAMRKRVYVLDKVNGPNGSGGVTLTGLDPLRLADEKKAEFPRTSDLEIYGDTNDTTTIVQVFGLEADLTADFGNTGSDRWLVAGNELIKYTGYTDEGDGIYTLTGVVRGDLGTTKESHDDRDKLQRAGRYVDEQFWRVASDWLLSHTEIPSAFVPVTDWDAEGNEYLPTYRTTRTVIDPTPVKDLIAELSQQGLFYIWWSEYDREIKMLAVRPPDTEPQTFTDAANLLRGSVLTREPDSRLTQVAVYYDQIDVFGGAEDTANYKRRFTSIDGDNLGDTRAKSIFAPWITNRTQAVQLAVRLLIRYRAVPEFLQVTIDAKDREAVLGTVLDIETRTIVDSEGNANARRWQVISSKELRAGHTYVLRCQTYEYFGRFGRFAPEDAPDFSAATDEQKAVGAWYAGDDGLMDDGSEGYQYQ